MAKSTHKTTCNRANVQWNVKHCMNKGGKSQKQCVAIAHREAGCGGPGSKVPK